MRGEPGFTRGVFFPSCGRQVLQPPTEIGMFNLVMMKRMNYLSKASNSFAI